MVSNPGPFSEKNVHEGLCLDKMYIYPRYHVNIKRHVQLPGILILTIRTSKLGGHYMPVILREQMTVLKQFRGRPPQNDIL
jgi:hypothetical protein